MAGRSHRRSPLAVAVLTLLAEAPMHAYRMQQLIKERAKDTIVNVAQRNSIYQTIDRLQRAELVRVLHTARSENRRPERTVYQITEQGGETLREWLHEMLSIPAREFPEFPVALASLPILEPAEVLRLLRAREGALLEMLQKQESELATDEKVLPRLFLIEVEYQHAVIRAELAWVRSVASDLESGALSWSNEWLRRFIQPSSVDENC